MSFVFKARRRAHSKAYVTVAATPKTDERASKIGKLYLDVTNQTPLNLLIKKKKK